MLHDLLLNSKFGSDFNFHLLTVANPDGYVNARLDDVMWRKNRSPARDNSTAKEKSFSQECTGVDLNRNFGFKHGESGTELKDQCLEYYSPAPFSEHESKG